MMKTSFLFLSFLLFTLSPNLPHVLADDALDPVLDTAGNQLRPGTNYYILPAVRGRGGGLTLASTRNETCPLDVVQAQTEVDNGLPVTFSPFNGDNVVRVSTEQNIKFSAATVCTQSTVWRLENVEGERVVTTGGVVGNPGRETLSNWFNIEKDGDDYKFVYCPGVCDICRPACGNIGVVVENGRRRLVSLSEVPLKVVFKKA
ncbi:hypothetical protein LguiB_007441 [Lonicera macranthoides]